MKKILIVLLLVLTVGCATKNTNKNVCGIDAPVSYLCDIANKYNVNIESVGKMIRISNAAAIATNKYSAKEALEVLKDIREKLETPIEYSFVHSAIKQIYKKHPELFIIMNEYIMELDIPEPMFQYDRDMLISWIDKLIYEMEFLISLQ